MTNEQVRDGFNAVYNNFWNRYKNNLPKEDSPEWKVMFAMAMEYRKTYPFLEEIINRMLTEFSERMRGRGNKPDAFHLPASAIYPTIRARQIETLKQTEGKK